MFTARYGLGLFNIVQVGVRLEWVMNPVLY